MPDIELMGATYPAVPAVNLPVSGGGTARFTDVADTTAAAADVASGKYFYTADGTRTAGTASGGGGVTYTTQAVVIAASAWSGTTATVSASAVTAASDVIVAPAPASIAAWAAAGVYCSAQGDGTLTFACSTAPTAALTANVMAFEGGGSVVLYGIRLYDMPTVTVDVVEAAEGQTVTVTIGGQTAMGITVKEEDGTATGGTVVATSGGYVAAGATWTFTMPAADVVLTGAAKPR